MFLWSVDQFFLFLSNPKTLLVLTGLISHSITLKYYANILLSMPPRLKSSATILFL